MILGPHVSSTGFLTVIAMIAFAANSLLCRMALGAGLIDASSFATIRVVAGAVILMLLALPRWRIRGREKADVIAVATLFLYMAFFSFAYLSLAAGTGALILFGAVQLTMFTAALHGGERFSPASWLGLTVALAELVYLVSPGLTAPDPQGALLMNVAGIAWGVYSLRGRLTADALGSTATNFPYCVPLVAAVSLFALRDVQASPAGVGLAIASSAVASGLGPRLRCLVRCAPRPNGQPRSDRTTVGTGYRSVRRHRAAGGRRLLAPADRVNRHTRRYLDRPRATG